jgi:hypothetical protein
MNISDTIIPQSIKRPEHRIHLPIEINHNDEVVLTLSVNRSGGGTEAIETISYTAEHTHRHGNVLSFDALIKIKEVDELEYNNSNQIRKGIKNEN